MKSLLLPLLCFSGLLGLSQESVSKKLPRITVDDKDGGYTLFTYKIPAAGYYTFAIDGGLLPKTDATIYYCEYQLLLRSQRKDYLQESLNVASQAQDGNVCYFSTNQKNNKISGVFSKDELVELKLVLHKSDINGQPHKQLNTTDNTIVSVQQETPSYAGQ